MADLSSARKRLEAYRFFTLDSGKQQGDRFLEPWISLLTMSRSGGSRRNLKRLSKQLDQFFNRKVIQQALAEAGSDKDLLMDEQLLDSARHYLEIAKNDASYNSALFGLIKLKEEDRVYKLTTDVQKHMLSTLIELDACPYRRSMLYALSEAFKATIEDAEESFSIWRESLDAERRDKLDTILTKSV